MRSRRFVMFLAASVMGAWIGAASIGHVRAAGEAAVQGDRPVEETHKNIQVLKGMPSSQLGPVMNSIRGALGVNCAFCHVVNGDKWEMEKDDKDEKKVARKMIQMVLDINKTSFEGKSEVTCYTCHRGSQRPLGVLPLPQAVQARPEAAEEAKRPELPPAQEILDRYVRAVGGPDAGDRVKTMIMKGTRENPGGNALPIEVTKQGTDRMLVVANTPNGTLTQGYNGKTGWVRSPRGIHEMDASELEQVRSALKMFEPLKTSSSAAGMKTLRTERLGDHDVYVVMSQPSKGTRLRMYFDTQSALLVRTLATTDTMLGALPEQIEYDDYRDVNGVKLPFAITSSNVDPWSNATRKFTEIKPNVEIEKGKFDPPAGASN